MYFYISLAIISIFCSSTFYIYKNKIKFLFNISRLLMKTFKNRPLINIGSSIKRLDDVILINDKDGVIIVPYKRKAAFKTVNSNIDLVCGNQRKRLNLYPGFDFNFSPNDLNCSSIEVNRDGHITIFRDDEKFNWDII